ncbi:MAG: FkbM family methyltransferase [Xenococcaceae cyanobacterium MO_167.B27]|nr:FkbM family methyltransferase [Xenococcaceae cyanobacterium MO_167.B27]
MFKFIRYYPFYKGRGWLVFLNIVQKYLKSLPLRLRASLYDGQIIFINPREYIGAMVYLFGDLDPKISWCIKKLLKKGDLFIDIGANCGTETIPASKIVEKDGAVHGFEPNSNCLDMLKSSICENHLENVYLYNYAVTDFICSINVRIPTNNSGSGAVSIDPTSSSQVVKAVTLDSIDKFKEKSIKLIKIDVEGHEYEVLKGAKRIFTENKPENVLIEIWFNPDVPFDQLPSTKFLLQHGYTPYQLMRRFGIFPRLKKVINNNISQSSFDYCFMLNK